MENEFDNTEEWLKRKLQDTDPVWSEDAWNDFENRRNKKRRGVLWFYFTAATLVVAIGSALLYNHSNSDSNPVSQIKNSKPEIVKNEAVDKDAKISSNENLGNTTNPSPMASNNSAYRPTPLYITPPVIFVRPNKTMDEIAAEQQPPQMIDIVADYDIPNTNSVTENPVTEKGNTNIEVPVTDPKILETPTIVQPAITKPTELPKVDKPNGNNDKPSKPYIKKTYIGLEYNPSQIILAHDISLSSANYLNASLSKNAAVVYNNFGVSVGRVINKNILMQSGINIYNYSTMLNYTEQTEKTILIAVPYTSVRMDTIMRRINMHTDTIYTSVKSIQNESRQTKVQLQYISIPLNVLYLYKCKSAQFGIGGGIVIQHLQNTPTSKDYNDDIKISPWKMNANIQFDAGWKLYKSVSIYTGYNIGYGVSNKTNYIQHGLKTGVRISL